MPKIKLVNAGITSKEDLAEKLMHGFKLHLDGFTLMYDSSVIGSPFRALKGSHSWALNYRWEHFSDVMKETEIPWHEDIGEGVLCSVWDKEGSFVGTGLVKEFTKGHSFPFLTNTAVRYKNAEPLTEEEVLKYVLDK